VVLAVAQVIGTFKLALKGLPRTTADLVNHVMVERLHRRATNAGER
jgi:hypothetical protein